MKPSFVCFAFILLTGCSFERQKSSQEVPTPVVEATDVARFQGVQKIMEARCVRCHDSSDVVALDSYEGIMENITAGSPEQSPLWTEIESGRMPRRAARLPAEEIEYIAQWILDGAKR